MLKIQTVRHALANKNEKEYQGSHEQIRINLFNLVRFLKKEEKMGLFQEQTREHYEDVHAIISTMLTKNKGIPPQIWYGAFTRMSVISGYLLNVEKEQFLKSCDELWEMNQEGTQPKF